MYNKVILMGRICRDLEVKTSNSGVKYIKFALAIDRGYVKDGERKTDFIGCTAWNKTAEFIARYFGKGSMIMVDGSIRTEAYTTADGKRITKTDVAVECATFTGEKKRAFGDGDTQNAEDAGIPPAPSVVDELEEYPF